MKITVINGTEKHGVTFRLKELFLAPFRATSEITEFYLPKNCPSFCCGCTVCILTDEHMCKDSVYLLPIRKALEEADLIVLTSPAYVFHATGAMKAFLDHMAVKWMPHRPSPAMFGKRAVIITQCLGAGAKSAAKDMRDSLSWWGISAIKTFQGRLLSNISWETLPKKKRNKLTKKINKLSEKFVRIRYDRPAKTNLKIKTRFYMCRLKQKSLHKNDPSYVDGIYWEEQGWLNKTRPWRFKSKK